MNEKLVVNKVEPAVGNVFRINCMGSYKTSELVARGEYDCVNHLITDEYFPIEAHEPVTREIELVGFYDGPISKEVLAAFSRRGLDRPTAEDALCFGIDYPYKQRKRPIAFLHEPMQDSNGNHNVLVLDGDAGLRFLSLRRFDYEWRRYYLFAGVRK